METDISIIKNAHIDQDHIDSLIRISEMEDGWEAHHPLFDGKKATEKSIKRSIDLLEKLNLNGVPVKNVEPHIYGGVIIDGVVEDDDNIPQFSWTTFVDNHARVSLSIYDCATKTSKLDDSYSPYVFDDNIGEVANEIIKINGEKADYTKRSHAFESIARAHIDHRHADRLIELCELEKGWATSGPNFGEPIDSRSISQSAALIELIEREYPRYEDVEINPSEDGTVQVEWRYRGDTPGVLPTISWTVHLYRDGDALLLVSSEREFEKVSTETLEAHNVKDMRFIMEHIKRYHFNAEVKEGIAHRDVKDNSDSTGWIVQESSIGDECKDKILEIRSEEYGWFGRSFAMGEPVSDKVVIDAVDFIEFFSKNLGAEFKIDHSLDGGISIFNKIDFEKEAPKRSWSIFIPNIGKIEFLIFDEKLDTAIETKTYYEINEETLADMVKSIETV